MCKLFVKGYIIKGFKVEWLFFRILFYFILELRIFMNNIRIEEINVVLYLNFLFFYYFEIIFSFFIYKYISNFFKIGCWIFFYNYRGNNDLVF